MMAASKHVLAVLGMLCVDKPFRAAFFAAPQAKAEWLVGCLGSDEVEQIQWLAGNGDTLGLSKSEFVAQLDDALDTVWAAIDCPDPPCPSPFAPSSQV
jgi:hypothetical protein